MGVMESGHPPVAEAAARPKCRLCESFLDEDRDDLDFLICKSCSTHPDALQLGAPSKTNPPAAPKRAQPRTQPALVSIKPPTPPKPRSFTPADIGLIRQLSGAIPTTTLLSLLNDRLVADLGPSAPRYTLDQLEQAREQAQPAESAARGSDWATLRQALEHARRNGLLQQITAQTVEDFAVIFKLTPAQLMRVKDVLFTSDDDEGEDA